MSRWGHSRRRSRRGRRAIGSEAERLPHSYAESERKLAWIASGVLRTRRELVTVLTQRFTVQAGTSGPS